MRHLPEDHPLKKKKTTIEEETDTRNTFTVEEEELASEEPKSEARAKIEDDLEDLPPFTAEEREVIENVQFPKNADEDEPLEKEETFSKEDEIDPLDDDSPVGGVEEEKKELSADTLDDLVEEEEERMGDKPKTEDDLPFRTNIPTTSSGRSSFLEEDLESENLQTQPQTEYQEVRRPISPQELDEEEPARMNSAPAFAPVPRRDPPFADRPVGNYRVNREAKGRSLKWHVLILLLIGIGIIGGSVYFLKSQFDAPANPTGNQEQAAVSTTPTPEPTAAPTQAPTVDRSSYTLNVLNGSGKTGLAASVSARLEELGYEVDKTGNATNSAFEKTVILVKDLTSSLPEQLKVDLAPDFNVVIEGGLSKTSSVDAEVILGAQ